MVDLNIHGTMVGVGVPAAATGGNIMNEYFEAIGYDCGANVPTGSSTWGETVGVGCSIDEDANPADVSSPSGWGTQCLKIVKATNAAVSILKTGLGLTDNYVRVEFVITAQGIVEGTASHLLELYDATDGKTLCTLKIALGGGNFYWYIDSFYDGATHTINGFVDPELNTLYRFEIKWDVTNNVWAWRLNGVDQANNVDTTSPVTSEGTLSSTHATHLTNIRLGTYTANANTYTVYYDRVGIDNTTWIGA